MCACAEWPPCPCGGEGDAGGPDARKACRVSEGGGHHGSVQAPQHRLSVRRGDNISRQGGQFVTITGTLYSRTPLNCTYLSSPKKNMAKYTDRQGEGIRIIEAYGTFVPSDIARDPVC